jgi:hypothetical protein
LITVVIKPCDEAIKLVHPCGVTSAAIRTAVVIAAACALGQDTPNARDASTIERAASRLGSPGDGPHRRLVLLVLLAS